MVSLGDNGFDSQAKENNENRCIPKGDYRMVLVNSERRTTKDGTGAYLWCDFQILDGEFQNKHIFTRFNLWLAPTKEKAIKIDKGRFSSLCRAVNVLTPKDTAELHNKPLIGKVIVEEDAEYGDDNDVRDFKPTQGRVSPVVGAVVNSAEGIAPASATPANANASMW